ncbi:NUDIX hydrolase [Acidimangrovimonas sediminis]|uniref:NUDIX hydrolase n=1 Tax=Acidimangrovimonas sediminis TaxID=2056283 RepID=UPI000C804314|nr:NUDIX hydrolase [Acidimangrovimonas sediminis]
MEFHGAKIALLCDGAVVSILRDDIPTIPWPGFWDLPGGGREGEESAAACVLRELDEELGLTLAPDRLFWRSVHPSGTWPGETSVFFAARLANAEVATLRLGDEGQDWRLMPVDDFLDHPRAIPFLKQRLRLVTGHFTA